MVHKYIIDKADIHDLLTGKEIPLPQGNKARAFCVEIAGGMTNGEVIQALFPDIVTHDMAISIHAATKVTCCGDKHCRGAISYDFWKEWWNAPYKAERGET